MDENKALDKVPENGSGEKHLAMFGNNHYFEFLYRKSEKLGIALYMITNFIKDIDPLKLAIRERSLDLLSLNLSLNTAGFSERKTILKECQVCGAEILSCISIAFHSGSISEMNFSILKKEIDRLLEDYKGGDKGEDNVLLSQNFFDIRQDLTPKNIPESIKDVDTKQSIVPRHSTAGGNPEISTKNRYFVKDRASAIRTNHTKATKEKKDDREEVILDLLRKKEGLSIKDFAGSITDCSEKTIQRELIYMVDQGIIRKEGERRWSKYYLAN